MKLKGHTKIELTDVNTGEKQVYEKDNIVTNALVEMCTPHGALGYTEVNKMGSLGVDINRNIDNLFKGIMLFEDNIEENVNNTNLLNVTSNLTGLSSTLLNTISSNNTLYGVYNNLESQRVENGFKFVYDWDTSHGNGPISAISLVPIAAGIMGKFNTLNTNSYDKDILSNQSLLYSLNPSWSTTILDLFYYKLISWTAFNPESSSYSTHDKSENCFQILWYDDVYMYGINNKEMYNNKNHITIYKWHFPLYNVGFLSDFLIKDKNKIIHKEYNIPSDYVYSDQKNSMYIIYDSNILYCFDSKYYTYSYDYKVGSSSRPLKIVKINLETDIIENLTFTTTNNDYYLNNLYRFSDLCNYLADACYYYNYPSFIEVKNNTLYSFNVSQNLLAIDLDTLECKIILESQSDFLLNQFLVLKDKILCFASDRNSNSYKKVYIINPNTKEVNNYFYFYSNYGDNNIVLLFCPMFSYGSGAPNLNIKTIKYAGNLKEENLILFYTLNIYSGGKYSGYSTVTEWIVPFINPFRLMTINNLSEPIIKKDTQTLKVTYTLTQEV